jgi:hypothetical protein
LDGYAYAGEPAVFRVSTKTVLELDPDRETSAEPVGGSAVLVSPNVAM